MEVCLLQLDETNLKRMVNDRGLDAGVRDDAAMLLDLLYEGNGEDRYWGADKDDPNTIKEWTVTLPDGYVGMEAAPLVVA